MDSDAIRTWLEDIWDGPRWWLAAFAAGVVLVIVTAAITVPLAYILDDDAAALTMLGLMIELVVLSMIGSGFVESMSRRLRQGGLQRETADLGESQDADRERMIEEEQRRSERRTLGAGIALLPVFVTFCVLLFR